MFSKKQDPQRILDKSQVDRNHVESYIFSGDRLVLSLDTGNCLEIYPEDERIGFRVSTEKPDIQSLEWVPGVVLRFAHGFELEWDWKKYLDALIGKQIALSLSEQALFILIRGQKDYYMIDYCRDAEDTNKNYLHIGFV